MTQAYAIVDLQFGSTGKGLLAGYLAKELRPDAVVTNWSPNAGHTYIGDDGDKYIHTMLANGVVSDSVKKVFIGPGSNLNLESLVKEIGMFDIVSENMEPFEVIIHQNAGVVTQEHRDQEESDSAKIGIGSTKKGVGAAVIDKINRDPKKKTTIGQLGLEKRNGMFCIGQHVWVRIVDTFDWINELESCELIQIEGCQGYSLGINSGMYPYTTSRECTVSQLLSDTLIPHTWLIDVYGVARTYPIRVANRYDEEGNMVGTSGPGYEDQAEITWESVGVEPELTTVTKLPRRIFSFSVQQFELAMKANGVTKLFMNFMNYLSEDDLEVFHIMVHRICQINGAEWEYSGWGPVHSDVRPNNTTFESVTREFAAEPFSGRVRTIETGISVGDTDKREFTTNISIQMKQAAEEIDNADHYALSKNGKPDLSLIYPDFVSSMAKVLEFGNNKHGHMNWTEGLYYRHTLAALKRHIAAWEKGEELDEETGESHLAHAATNLMYLCFFENNGYGQLFDDCPFRQHLKAGKSPDEEPQ